MNHLKGSGSVYCAANDIVEGVLLSAYHLHLPEVAVKSRPMIVVIDHWKVFIGILHIDNESTKPLSLSHWSD